MGLYWTNLRSPSAKILTDQSLCHETYCEISVTPLRDSLSVTSASIDGVLDIQSNDLCVDGLCHHIVAPFPLTLVRGSTLNLMLSAGLTAGRNATAVVYLSDGTEISAQILVTPYLPNGTSSP